MEWRFWRAGDTEMYTGLRIMELIDGKLVLREDNIDLFISLVKDFLLRDPAQIKSSSKLAEYMAMHARTIRSIVSGILKDDGNGQPLFLIIKRECLCSWNCTAFIAGLNQI